MLQRKRKRIIITGGNGFVGRNLSSFLIKEGHDVFSVERNPPDTKTKGGVRILKGDILDKEFLYESFSLMNPDIVFHFAAQSSVSLSFRNPTQSMETNIIGTSCVVETMRNTIPDCRLVFSSSAEVYGNLQNTSFDFSTPDGNLHYLMENEPIFPSTSPYSISKISGEYLMQCYGKTFGMDIITVRSFNIEGPGRGDNFATSIICQQAANLIKSGKKEYYIGNIAVFRDFTHVKDAVQAYYLLASKGESGETYNLGSMKITSLASFLLYATEAAGIHIEEIVFGNGKRINQPLNTQQFRNISEITSLDICLLSNPTLVYPEHGPIILRTVRHGDIIIHIEPDRFRPAENMIMVADNHKIFDLGFQSTFSVRDIASEHVSQYVIQEDQS